MTNTTKRTLSLVLVIALIFSLGITALAVDKPLTLSREGSGDIYEGQTITLKGTVASPTANFLGQTVTLEQTAPVPAPGGKDLTLPTAAVVVGSEGTFYATITAPTGLTENTSYTVKASVTGKDATTNVIDDTITFTVNKDGISSIFISQTSTKPADNATISVDKGGAVTLKAYYYKASDTGNKTPIAFDATTGKDIAWAITDASSKFSYTENKGCTTTITSKDYGTATVSAKLDSNTSNTINVAAEETPTVIVGTKDVPVINGGSADISVFVKEPTSGAPYSAQWMSLATGNWQKLGASASISDYTSKNPSNASDTANYAKVAQTLTSCSGLTYYHCDVSNGSKTTSSEDIVVSATDLYYVGAYSSTHSSTPTVGVGQTLDINIGMSKTSISNGISQSKYADAANKTISVSLNDANGTYLTFVNADGTKIGQTTTVTTDATGYGTVTVKGVKNTMSAIPLTATYTATGEEATLYESSLGGDDYKGTLNISVGDTSAITLNAQTLDIATGDTKTLTATTTPAGGTVTWSTSNSSVATVTNGAVKGVKAGSATITATCNGKSKTCAVTVKDQTVTLNQTSASVVINNTITLTATASPIASATAKQGVTWTTSSAAIATVTDGVVKGIKAGTATITATSKYDTTKKATCTVTVTASALAPSATVPAGDGAVALDSTTPSIVSQITTANSSIYYIKFTGVSSTYGTLSANTTTNYYLSGISSTSHTLLSSVTYTPGTTEGSDTYSFTAYNLSGTPLATGTMTITVKDESTDTMDVYYNTVPSGTVNLNEEDFINWFLSQNTKYASLTSVAFAKNSTSNGTLYAPSGISNSAITASAEYYTTDYAPKTNSKLLSSVYFKATKAAGAYPVHFVATGKLTNGGAATVEGNVYFCVTSAAVSDISYNVAYGTTASLNEADFTSVYKTALNNNTTAPKFYVRFVNMPAYGTMYRYGTASNSYKITASQTQNYTVNSTQTSTNDKFKVDDIIYTPAAITTGVYPASYAVYDLNGALKYIGTVNFNYKDNAKTIKCGGEGYTFRVADFVATTDKDPIVSVTFAVPATTANGKMYTNYSHGSGTLMTANNKFTTTSGGTITTATYIPNASNAQYPGSTKLTYTAVTKAGKSVSGTITMAFDTRTTAYKFSDVHDSWAIPPVDFCSQWGIVNGEGTGFNPSGSMQRGMLVTMLWRAYGSPIVSTANPFNDVKSTDYFYNAVLWAYSAKIVTGTSAKTFSPTVSVSRQDIAAMLYRYSGSSYTGTVTGFTDAGSVSSYARNAMAWAVNQGIISGSTDGRLNPTATGTRAQVVAMIHRYLAK